MLGWALVVRFVSVCLVLRRGAQPERPFPHARARRRVHHGRPEGVLAFHPAPPPTDAEVARLLTTIRARVLRRLRRHGLGPDAEGSRPDPVAEESPVLAGLEQCVRAGTRGAGAAGGRAVAGPGARPRGRVGHLRRAPARPCRGLRPARQRGGARGRSRAARAALPIPVATGRRAGSAPAHRGRPHRARVEAPVAGRHAAISSSSRWTCLSGWPRSRPRPHHTTPGENLPPERVTVTLPIHPFHGMALAVVRLERDHQGHRDVIVEHPHGGQLRLPLDWTDRAAPAVPPQVNGRDVRLSLRGLRALAAAVGVARARKRDVSEVGPAPSSQAEEASPRSARATGRVGRAVGRRAARPARGVGVSPAQDPAATRGGPR